MGDQLTRNRWFLYRHAAVTDMGTDELLSVSAPRVLVKPRPVPERPIFVDRFGRTQDDVNAFFRSPTMTSRATATVWRYAYSIGVWLNFLEVQGASWDSATEDDLAAFKFWRRSDPNNEARVSGSSWHSDVAAYLLLYDWAGRHGLVETGPGTASLSSVFATSSSRRFSTNQVRSSDVKWFTPAAYRRWRDTGILGIDVAGRERVRWRPRSEERDQAFSDALYGTGLRLQECSSVLVHELPHRDPDRLFQIAHLAGACAKGGRGRPYFIRDNLLGLITNYVDHDRRAAIERANENGLYDQVKDRLIVENITPNGLIDVTDRNGLHLEFHVDTIDPDSRRRLYIRERNRLAPAQLWLNENGSPRAKHAWYSTFAAANRRVASAGIDRLVCHPHILRHSFALRWYAVGRLAWENKIGHLSAEETRDFRAQFGDTWGVIQGLLGHASVETTRNIYLEPFRHLNTALLLEQVDDDAAAEFQLRTLRANPRVQHDRWAEIGPTA